MTNMHAHHAWPHRTKDRNIRGESGKASPLGSPGVSRFQRFLGEGDDSLPGGQSAAGADGKPPALVPYAAADRDSFKRPSTSETLEITPAP